MIDNPAYKGEWKPKQVKNPSYKGKVSFSSCFQRQQPFVYFQWVHPEIDNPEYAPDDDLYLYKDLGAIGFDLWQVKSGTIFDNVLITDSVEEAKSHAAETFEPLRDAGKINKTIYLNANISLTFLEKKKKEEHDEKERKKLEEEEKKRKEEEETKKDDDEAEEEEKEEDKEDHDEL